MLVLATAIVLFTGMASMPGGLPDSVGLTPAGQYPFREGSAVVLDTSRWLAFAAAGGGVIIVDVADPAAPRVLSDRIRGSAWAKDLCLEAGRLCVANFSFNYGIDSPRDVDIWDVRDPAEPQLLGSVDALGAVSCVTTRGPLLLAGSIHYLAAYDISDPNSPLLLDAVSDGGCPEMIVIRDTLALVSWSGPNAVKVLNIADPASMSLVSQWGPTTTFPGVCCVGDTLLMASSYGVLGSGSGLRVYDISNPSNGRLLGSFDTLMAGAYRVAVRDTLAVVAYARDEGGTPLSLKVVSVADPSLPRQLASWGDRCHGVALRDTLAYVTFDDRFAVLSLADPAHPRQLGFVPLGLAGAGVAVEGGLVYSIGVNLAVLDATRDEFELLSLYVPRGRASGYFAARETLVLLACADSQRASVEVVGLSDPRSPHLLSELPAVGQPYAMLLQGNTAFVSDSDRLRCYDLTDPVHPVELGSVAANMRASVLRCKDTFIYSAAAESLLVFGVADPRRPAVLGAAAGSVFDMCLRDSLLYAAMREGALSVFSIVEPASPRLVWRGYGGDYLPTLALGDTYLLRTYQSGLTFYSLAQPDSPVRGRWFPKQVPPGRILLRDDTLFTSLTGRYHVVRAPAGVGGEPQPRVPPRPLRVWPSVAREYIFVSEEQPVVLYDAGGRRVMDLAKGRTDIRRLRSGVYFCRSGSGSVAIKVVVQR